MEQPYKGQAIINDNVIDVQIIIPTKRNWFIIVFLGGWLGGWFMGEMFALGVVIGMFGGKPVGLFILFWLVAWTAGGFFAIKTFLWHLRGKEVITIGQGKLSIDKKGALLVKPKTYDLNEVKNIRVQNNVLSGFLAWQRNDLSAFGYGGTIRFDYGLRTISFANGIDEAEAKFIIDKLKEKHFFDRQKF